MADKCAVRLLRSWKSSKFHTFSSISRTKATKFATIKPDVSFHKTELKDGKLFEYFDWIGKHTPSFKVKGNNVLVITEPTEFFEILKIKTRKAKRRVTFASLYLGTGHLEHQLVGCLEDACENARKNNNTDFKVNILLDYTRGSRGRNLSSRTMLQPLIKEFSDSVNVSLYHTPELRGLLKKLVPERFNETIGLTHVKVYIFDDSFIISGANLSENYFTNRQDRYMLFNDCKELADFFDKLVQSIRRFSFKMTAENKLTLSSPNSIHPFLDNDDGSRFKRLANDEIQTLIRSSMEKNLTEDTVSDQCSTIEYDTVVYPLIQMKSFGITTDEDVTLNLLTSAKKEDDILLASGYFNLTDHYMHVILRESQAKYEILMASPEVNGFFGAKGIAGSIPLAYIHVAWEFYRELMKNGQTERIKMFEYFRDKWTFHAKGLWYYLPGEASPSLTLIGSPNFGYRSVYRDLECQLAVVTDNQLLKQQLREEHARLFQSSKLVTEDLFKRKDRHVPLWAKLVTRIIKNFF